MKKNEQIVMLGRGYRNPQAFTASLTNNLVSAARSRKNEIEELTQEENSPCDNSSKCCTDNDNLEQINHAFTLPLIKVGPKMKLPN